MLCGMTITITGVGVNSVGEFLSYGAMLLCLILWAGVAARLTRFFFGRPYRTPTIKMPWYFVPTFVWGDRSRRVGGFVGMFGKIFAVYTPKRQWFVVFDMGVSMLQAGLISFRPPFPSCRENIFAVMAATSVLYLFALLVMDPFLTFFNRIFMYTITVMYACGFVIGAVMGFSDSDEWDQEKADNWATAVDQIGIVTFAIAFACTVGDLAMTFVRKSKGVSLDPPEAATDSDDDVVEDDASTRKLKKAQQKAELQRLAASKEAAAASLTVGNQQGGDAAHTGLHEALLSNYNHEEPDPVVRQILAQGVWARVKDTEGNPYYFNTQTGKSAWDLNQELMLWGAGYPEGGGAAFLMKKKSRFRGYLSSEEEISSLSEDDERSKRRKRRKARQEKRERRQQKKEAKKKSDKKHKVAEIMKDLLVKGEWDSHTDPGSGKVYYYNPKTRKTTWDLAKEIEAELDERAKRRVQTKEEFVEDVLKQGEWKKVQDAATKNYYYYNRATKQTTWDLAETLNYEEIRRQALAEGGDDGAHSDSSSEASTESGSTDSALVDSLDSEDGHCAAPRRKASSKRVKKSRNLDISALMLDEGPAARRDLSNSPDMSTQNIYGSAVFGKLLVSPQQGSFAMRPDSSSPGRHASMRKAGTWTLSEQQQQQQQPGTFHNRQPPGMNPLHVSPHGGIHSSNFDYGEYLVAEALRKGEWVEAIGGNGKVVYVNPVTKTTTRNLRDELLGVNDSTAARLGLMCGGDSDLEVDDPVISVEKALRSGAWAKVTDPNNGRPFYVHVESQRIVFDLEAELRKQMKLTADTRRRKQKQRRDPHTLMLEMLKTGEWVLATDPFTKNPCYKNTASGAITFDLLADITSGKVEPNPLFASAISGGMRVDSEYDDDGSGGKRKKGRRKGGKKRSARFDFPDSDNDGGGGA